MAIEPGTYNLGPQNGKLIIKTGVEGPGARMAHALVIEATRWNATATVAEDPGASSLSASVDIGSFEIREGHGGVKPLSDNDRNEIKKNITGKILGSGQISYQSSSVSSSGNSATVQGTLTIAGKSGPLTVNLSDMGGRVKATATIVQSNFGIKPFKGPLGAFRLKDAVDIEVEASV
ncbi:MAG TPA: YceI family protein [Actinomycetota bacterium]|nr:YceI family protein [Actinomycetota bacterium]